MKYTHGFSAKTHARRKKEIIRARASLRKIGISKKSISKMGSRAAVDLAKIMRRHKTKYAHMKKAMQEYMAHKQRKR